ncbi:hypothetical protein [Halomicronema sp. CCY15110]|uniref:hypothetical protein n=1 Tax=Halomicronema sp. CCY15110 TaxID=2767773 RepID=UPI0019509D8E|nr:hypothetical protein [Halomicronema sp. CCY15110]
MESTDALTTDILKALIKESLREVLREERLNLSQLLMPFVSNQEQAEIDASFGSPEDYDDEELINLTDWVRHGGSIQ